MINGILNVYKEPGFTSHDVVAKLRGITCQKKIGHTGTLDPAATGVLPVCLGKATKVCAFLTEQDKTYEAILLLGTTTDTQDATGNTLRQADAEDLKNIAPEAAVAAILSFAGESFQIPPMYSALKKNGKKLYEYARAGVEIERAPRKITISDIRIIDIELPRIRFSVTCSKGTYIRTLCDDIGRKLGVGGCVETLKRTRVGVFNIENSLTLREIEDASRDGQLNDILIGIDSMFEEFPSVTVAEEYNKLLYNGCPVPADDRKTADSKARLYDMEKRFIGLYELNEGVYRPIRLFFDREEISVNNQA